MRKIILLLINLIGIFVFSQGIQNYGINFFPKSPNATQFANFGKYPVNLFKGQPTINIPLFLDKKNNISLSYYVNSVKPATIPTWVGLGWNLQAGGAITRIVKGGVDEIYQNNISPYNRYSYLDNYSILDNSNWNNLSAMQNYFSNNLVSGTVPQYPVPDPDEFIINALGITGSFYLNEKGKWIGRTTDGRPFSVNYHYKNDYLLVENDKMIVSLENNDLKRILYGFDIVMNDGTKYIFGSDDAAIEFSATNENIDSFNPQIIPSSWMLKEVDYVNGKKTVYSYTRDESAIFTVNRSGNYSYYSNNTYSYNISSASGGSIDIYNTSRLNTSYLSKIQNEDYTIDFFNSIANQKEYNASDFSWGGWEPVYNAGHHLSAYSNNKHWHKLDSINISNSTNNKVINRVVFNYNNDSSDRLLLNNIVINNSEKYSFLYNSQKLPDYTTGSTDAWGYYNGNTFFDDNRTTLQNSNNSQLFDLLKNSYPNSRLPNLQLSKAETLQQITYPTGGNTYFTYELNEYSKYGNKDISNNKLLLANTSSNQIAGGLRIQKISSCDENNKCVSKKYSYLLDDNITSSGLLPYKPVYVIEGQDGGGLLTFWEFNFNSYQTLTDSDNTVGYSKVTEKDDNGGKNETYFTNYDYNDSNDTKGDAYYGFISDGFYKQLPYASYSLSRGKPLREIMSSSTGIIKDVVYQYQSQQNFIKAYAMVSKQFGQAHFNGAYTVLSGVAFANLIDAYRIIFNTNFLTQKTTIFQGNTEVENFSYEFENNNLLNSTVKTSDGNLRKTNYLYALEKNNQPMLNANMVGIPLETNTFKNTTATSKVETIYPTYLPTAQTGNLLLPLSVQSTQTNTISSAVPPTGETKTTEITYDQYDISGNLLQYTTKAGISTAIIWGYNSTRPIAKIEDATYAQVSSLATALIAASDLDAADPTKEPDLITALDTLRKDPTMANYQITTYTYDPLIGVTSITPPSGIREIYKYDSANRLQSVTDVNGKVLKEYKYNYKQ